MSSRIEVTYKVVTPMFCGGARPDTAELRLPSFKGVLRWWWRALAWSRCGGNLARIEREENELFGSARTGRGKISMRLVGQPLPPRQLKHRERLMLGEEVVGEGARYLGYGVMESFDRKAKGDRPAMQAGQLSRAYVSPGSGLTIELLTRDLDDPRALLDALQAVGLLGGMGAKSRKGYGSLALQSLTLDGKPRWSPPRTMKDLEGAIRHLLPRESRSTLPLYTAISGQTRVVLVARSGENRPLGLLDRIGREMVRYRSWGHNGRVLGEPREENFKDDHDLMKSRGRKAKHPQRIIFGLPHNYGDDKVGPHDDHLDRRASPLLIHLHECDRTAIGVLSALPAMFLPGGQRAKIDVAGSSVPISPEQELWKPLHDFLDRLVHHPKEKFEQVEEIRP